VLKLICPFINALDLVTLEAAAFLQADEFIRNIKVKTFLENSEEFRSDKADRL